MISVRNRKQRVQSPQITVGTPVLGQLDDGPTHVGRVPLQLLLELLEERKRVRNPPGEPAPGPPLDGIWLEPAVMLM